MVLLLISSCYFLYDSFVPIYILYIGFYNCCRLFCRYIYRKATHGRQRQLFLICSLIANIGVLAVLRYLHTISWMEFKCVTSRDWATQTNTLFIYFTPYWFVVSYIQAMEELYDRNLISNQRQEIYGIPLFFVCNVLSSISSRPNWRPQRNPASIQREKHDFDYDRVTDGLKLMAWGLFKKVVIADKLANTVNIVCNNPTRGYHGLKPHENCNHILFVPDLFVIFQGGIQI